VKVIHLSRSSSLGGAARAAMRVHRALLDQHVDSRVWTVHGDGKGPNLKGPASGSDAKRYIRRLRQARRIMNLVAGRSENYRSLSMMPSDWSAKLRAATPDITHLHWVNAEMMSIADIGRLSGPVVWTLHDMWAFAGAHHVDLSARWQQGYPTRGADVPALRLDLDRWLWRQKRKHWRRPIQIVAPSKWMADCVAQSALMSDWPVTVIGNPLDTSIWAQQPKAKARRALGLDPDCAYILFGAFNASSDPTKGFDLLNEALARFSSTVPDVRFLMFGNARKMPDNLHGIALQAFGQVNDDRKLAQIYAAADLSVVPSRMESFGQTATEAMSCGTPVVAFSVGGLKDIVTHRQTGYLAQPYDTADLARGMAWTLEQMTTPGGEGAAMAARARAHVAAAFDMSAVARKYIELYQDLKGRQSP